MRITLVSTYTQPIALGLRYVSAYLKHAGHEVDMILMSARRDTAKANFSESMLQDLIERVRDRDLIGMSLMTNSFHRACVLTERIRQADIKAPIIWGGVHPTVAPDESLEVADIICVGEGEEPMRRLAERLQAGKDPKDIGNLGFRGGGPFGNKHTFHNPVLPLESKLDDYPFPDYELETHYVADTDALEPARVENLRGTLRRLRVETTRGCPYHCSFCNNTTWQRIYKGKGTWVRKRSTDNIIAEIQHVRARFPTIEAVNIVDDLFFVRSEEEMEKFALAYAQRVNLPLELDAFPNTVTRAKIESLLRVPIHLISMGIQSGSPETLKEIYHRPTPIEKIVECINGFADHRIRAEYHYIINNPFESDLNRIETLRFAATHQRGPAIFRIFPLQFYPGTPLYDRAREAAFTGPRHDMTYQHTYTGKTHVLGSQYLDIWLRVVLHLRNWGIPSSIVHRLIDVVTHRWVLRVIDRRWFVPVAYGMYRINRFVARKLIYQPLRLLKYLRRRGRDSELYSVHAESELTWPGKERTPGRTKPPPRSPGPLISSSSRSSTLPSSHQDTQARSPLDKSR